MIPVLKITIADNDSGDVLETFYTDSPLLEFCDVMKDAAVMFDTPEELVDARQENDRG